MSEANEESPEEVVAEEALAVVAPPLPELPGRALREAREARRLTVYEVAQSLKFSPRQIEALEADDYAALPPGATFQRGFVRGYAKLLKLDPAPLLAMLDARTPVALPDVREPQNMGVAATPVAAGRRSSRPMLLGAAGLAVLAVALGIWHFAGAPTPARAPAPAANDVASVRPPDIRIEESPATAEGQTAGAPRPSDQRQLVFVFHDKSWVEVRDATQHIVFSGENEAGARLPVSGKPPFQLVVGNADKVELQYEDRQVDLKPHTRAEVARLTLE